MIDPLFFLGLSILLVAVSLAAVLVALLPAVQELARAARSAEKLFDTLRRELPPTLEAIRLTGLEISDLTDDINQGVKSAGQVAKQVDEGVSSAKKQAQKVQVNTRSVFAGVKAAWKAFNRPTNGRRSVDRLPPDQRSALDLRNRSSTFSDTGPSVNPDRVSRPDFGNRTNLRQPQPPDSDVDEASAYSKHDRDLDSEDY